MEPERWLIPGGFALGVGALATSRALGVEGDGHAAGADASSSSTFVSTVPRRTGLPQAFSAPLDGGTIGASSGGSARDLAANTLPKAGAYPPQRLAMAPRRIIAAKLGLGEAAFPSRPREPIVVARAA